jgi:hypothetical protein
MVHCKSAQRQCFGFVRVIATWVLLFHSRSGLWNGFASSHLISNARLHLTNILATQLLALCSINLVMAALSCVSETFEMSELAESGLVRPPHSHLTGGTLHQAPGTQRLDYGM